MPKDKNNLFDIKVKEISVVPKGANKKKIFLKKEQDGGNDMDIDKDTLVELNEAFKKELPEELEKEFKKVIEKGLSEKAQKALKGALKLLGAHKEEIGEKALKALSAKAGFGFPEVKKEEPKKPEDIGMKSPFKKEYSEVKKGLSNLIAEDRKEDFDKLMKEVEVESTPLVEDPKVMALQKEMVDQKKVNKELSDKIVLKEKVEEAKEFNNLNSNPEKLGKILKEMDETLSKETKKELTEILKAANNQLSENNVLLKEVGSSSSFETNDTEKMIEKKAEELRKEDPKLTEEQAYSKALDQNPELYTKHLNEKK